MECRSLLTFSRNVAPIAPIARRMGVHLETSGAGERAALRSNRQTCALPYERAGPGSERTGGALRHQIRVGPDQRPPIGPTHRYMIWDRVQRAHTLLRGQGRSDVAIAKSNGMGVSFAAEFARMLRASTAVD